MIGDKETAQKVAEYLLQIKAIILQPSQPFTWASGWKSPIYCDNRKTLSYPKIRTYIRQEMVNVILDKWGNPDVIAGVATGGIAQGALVAEALGVSFVYVRPQPKQHGLTNTIEGVAESGQSVVVIEDLISTGSSSLAAIEALRKAGLTVKGMVAIFSYGFDEAVTLFKQHKCPVYTLTDYEILLKQAYQTNYIKSVDLKSLDEWRKSPKEWKR